MRLGARGLLVVAGALVLIVVAGPPRLRNGGSFGGEKDPAAAATTAARRFLDGYLNADGRVVRRDEGGDTVSEGQAYAMLLAVVADDRAAFDRAWGWAKDNLRRPDGLLSWLWRDGQVREQESAADADLDAARALLLAADRFGDDRYADEARRIAPAVLAHETLHTDTGPLVVAGPWAVKDRHFVNPSYIAPRAFDLLEESSGDPQWGRAAEAGYRAVGALLRGTPPLPPDWATLPKGGVLTPAGEPGGGRGVQYGLDAVRLPVRIAEDCDERGKFLAATMWPFLESEWKKGRIVATYGLDGRPSAGYEHPASIVGAAGAATAAGDERTAARLLDHAEALERKSPTYYGAAWVALGRAMLTTDLLGGC